MINKIYKYWATHYKDIPRKEILSFYPNILIDINIQYYVTKSLAVFEIVWKNRGWGPFDTEEEAQRLCDFFNRG